MSDKRTSLGLHSFIVFDPTLTSNENQEIKKILYCYPETISIDEQTKTIGLCQAMINFAREFTKCPCQYIHTLKTRIIMHTLEDKISMILTVDIPKREVSVSSKKSDVNSRQSEHDEYLDEDIQNSVCESVIKHCGQMFSLFMGPPSVIIKNNDLEYFKEKLSKFFKRYIGHGMLDSYHIVDCLTGVQYFSIAEDEISHVESYFRKFENTFHDIFYSMLLFNDQLVYSTVSSEDQGILYRYITTTLLTNQKMKDVMNSVFTSTNMGHFVHGPKASPVDKRLPKIFLRTNDYVGGHCSCVNECYILVYKALQATVVLFVKQSTTIDQAFYTKIHEYLGPGITLFANNTMKRSSRVSLTDNLCKYVYWNPETLSVKCTLFPTRQLKSDLPPCVPMDTMRVMNDVKGELDRDGDVKEVTVKLQSDCWVSCLSVDRQQLFMVVAKKNVAIGDLSKELRQICMRDLPDTFRPPSE